MYDVMSSSLTAVPCLIMRSISQMPRNIKRISTIIPGGLLGSLAEKSVPCFAV